MRKFILQSAFQSKVTCVLSTKQKEPDRYQVSTFEKLQWSYGSSHSRKKYSAQLGNSLYNAYVWTKNCRKFK